jgi:hypothetical protein
LIVHFSPNYYPLLNIFTKNPPIAEKNTISNKAINLSKPLALLFEGITGAADNSLCVYISVIKNIFAFILF